MSWKKWTKEEVARLYKYSTIMSQKEAAELLGRSAYSVSHKIRHLGFTWGQGYWSLGKIAKEVGCSSRAVRRVISILYPDDEMAYSSGRGKRFKIEHGRAERIIKVLKGTRPHRERYIRAGRMSHKGIK